MIDLSCQPPHQLSSGDCSCAPLICWSRWQRQYMVFLYALFCYDSYLTFEFDTVFYTAPAYGYQHS